MPVREWADTISQLDIYFEGRVNLGLLETGDTVN